MMVNADHDQLEKPATWENIVVGKVKDAVGRVIGDEELELAAEGQEQEDVVHDVRSEFRDKDQP